MGAFIGRQSASKSTNRGGDTLRGPASGNVTADAGVAQVTVTAYGATADATALAALAAVTVAAQQPTAKGTATAGLAGVTVAALNAEGVINAAPAGTAQVSVTAYNPTVSVVAFAGVATVSVAANGSTAVATATPSVAPVTVTAEAPTVSATATAGVAGVTSAAYWSCALRDGYSRPSERLGHSRRPDLEPHRPRGASSRHRRGLRRDGDHLDHRHRLPRRRASLGHCLRSAARSLGPPEHRTDHRRSFHCRVWVSLRFLRPRKLSLAHSTRASVPPKGSPSGTSWRARPSALSWRLARAGTYSLTQPRGPSSPTSRAGTS